MAMNALCALALANFQHWRSWTRACMQRSLLDTSLCRSMRRHCATFSVRRSLIQALRMRTRCRGMSTLPARTSSRRASCTRPLSAWTGATTMPGARCISLGDCMMLPDDSVQHVRCAWVVPPDSQSRWSPIGTSTPAHLAFMWQSVEIQVPRRAGHTRALVHPMRHTPPHCFAPLAMPA